MKKAKMKQAIPHLFISMLIGFSGNLSAAEDPAKLCQSAAQLYKENDIQGALEEAKWCLETLEQIVQNKQADAFAENIAGWKRGKLNQNKAMGMTVTDTTYTKGSASIKVTLTGGNAGLGALAQMGMMNAGKKVRIQRKAATVTAQGNNVTVLIGLEGGKLLNLEARGTTEAAVIEFAEGLPIRKLDK